MSAITCRLQNFGNVFFCRLVKMASRSKGVMIYSEFSRAVKIKTFTLKKPIGVQLAYKAWAYWRQYQQKQNPHKHKPPMLSKLYILQRGRHQSRHGIHTAPSHCLHRHVPYFALTHHYRALGARPIHAVAVSV